MLRRSLAGLVDEAAFEAAGVAPTAPRRIARCRRVGQASEMGEVQRELAHAKLTRRLHIVGRRADGYHLLDAEMVSIDLADELTFADGDELEVTDAIAWSGKGAPEGPAVPTDSTNLVAEGARARVAARLGYSW